MIGNREEMLALGQALVCKTDNVTEIVKLVARSPKANKKRERVVVATQGKKETALGLYYAKV